MNLCKWLVVAIFWMVGVGVVFANDPQATALMEQVRRSIPEVPLEMNAAIRVVNSHGKAIKTIQAEALLTPWSDGRTARYTLLDAFGGVLEEMSVELGSEGTAFSFSQGDTSQPAPLPDLFAPIQGSDISWMELSFSFFWWPNPKIVGTEKLAKRWDCKVIEIPCPSDLTGGWSHLRLWVAPAYNAVICGEAWRDGRAVKRFEVKSVKKLRHIYMIGDLEVKNLETGSRSQLKVSKMRMISPAYTPEELEEFNAPVAW